MAKLIDLNGLAHVYSIIKGMLADKLGKNDTAVNASKVNNLTVETAVPKNAKFTDTVYTHPSTHPASMITGLASVATSGSYNDLTDKPTIPASITIDSELSTTSTNPVQNKVIKEALDGKLGKNETAARANKLNTNGGSATQPIYFANGVPVATTYTLGKSVPSDAKFTDTVYNHPSTHPASMITGLSTVATSGSYNDLTNKPTIPAAITVDAELSDTSTNPVQNRVIKAALDGKLGKNETAARATQDGAGNTISTTYASKTDVSALMSTKLDVTATAYAATRDGAGNNIVDTYAKKTDISDMVKSVNGTAPDASGNVNVKEYTHPASGVTAGSYRKVTVDTLGHVTAGENPILAIAEGGTGADNATAARTNLGIDTTYFNPTGTIIAFAGNTLPKGYLLCDGSKVSRTTYKKLFDVIGTTYGTGDGSTTFNLPNLTDKFIQGSDTAGTVKSAGLPNITSRITSGTFEGYQLAISGMVSNGGQTGALKYRDFTAWTASGWSDSAQYAKVLDFNASWSNSIYGKSTTVQPPALTMRYIIKY